jgi:hypothetical protein
MIVSLRNRQYTCFADRLAARPQGGDFRLADRSAAKRADQTSATTVAPVMLIAEGIAAMFAQIRLLLSGKLDLCKRKPSCAHS